MCFGRFSTNGKSQHTQRLLRSSGGSQDEWTDFSQPARSVAVTVRPDSSEAELFARTDCSTPQTPVSSRQADTLLSRNLLHRPVYVASLDLTPRPDDGSASSAPPSLARHESPRVDPSHAINGRPPCRSSEPYRSEPRGKRSSQGRLQWFDGRYAGEAGDPPGHPGPHGWHGNLRGSRSNSAMYPPTAHNADL